MRRQMAFRVERTHRGADGRNKITKRGTVGLLEDMRRLNQDCCYIIFIQNSSKDSKMQEYLKINTKSNGRWTKQEHLKFLEGLRIYGKNWKKIEQLVQTRSGSQIRSHAQKFFLKSKGPENASEQDYWVGGTDIQEQHQQITENSKSAGESQSHREHMSYFLGRIVDYSTGRTCLDFWEDLVDIKGASEYAKEPERKNSFTNVEDEEQDSLSERPPQKKVKV